jgi:hypothetical protein
VWHKIATGGSVQSLTVTPENPVKPANAGSTGTDERGNIMKSRAMFLLAGASLLVGVSAPSGLVLAQEKAMTPADVMATKGTGNTDPSGATGPLSAQEKASTKQPAARVAMPATMYACLEMDYDASTTAMWYINAKVGAAGNITSATVSGAICGSPNWTVTGSLWPQEDIVGNRNGSGGSCNTKITIKGSLQGFIFWEGPVPPTSMGTTSGYNFPSMGPNQYFPQTTHLRSYSPTPVSCP